MTVVQFYVLIILDRPLKEHAFPLYSTLHESSWQGASVKFHTHYLNHSKSTHCIAGRNLQHRTTGWIQQVISIINIQKRKIGLVIRTSLAILAQKIVSSLWIAPPQETVAPKKQTSTSCGFLGSCLIIPDPRPWWVHESKIGESNTITAWCLAYCWYTVDIVEKWMLMIIIYIIIW